MYRFIPPRAFLERSLITLIPLSLWGLVWISINPGPKYLQGILFSDTIVWYPHAARAALPVALALVALMLILPSARSTRLGKDLLWSPLGFASAYGIVGVVASVVSPDPFQALYWSVVYLSVPLVLWAIRIRFSSFDHIRSLVKVNLLIIVFAGLTLFALALAYLDLGGMILRPSNLFTCQLYYPGDGHHWTELGSPFSAIGRPTAVGRYAGIAALIAMSLIFGRNFWPLWVAIFLACFVVLLSSGARTAFVGFAVAAPVVIILHTGKKGVLICLMALLLFTSLMSVANIRNDFIQSCIYRGASIVNDKPSISEKQTETSDLAAVTDNKLTPPGLFTFSGRTQVWRTALERIQESPFLGFGFFSDRIILGSHIHNAIIHALFQTGAIGAGFFVAAIALTTIQLVKVFRSPSRLSTGDRSLAIQSAGILAFLAVRGVTESTGAFFGIDWLLIGPLMLYVSCLNRGLTKCDS